MDFVELPDGPGLPPFMIQAALGNVAGAEIVHKFGAHPGLTAAPEDIWSYGGTYSHPTAPISCKLSSSNAGDAVEVVVVGLDASGDMQRKSVTLEGQTPVDLAGLWTRVFRAYNADADAGGFPGGGTNLAGDVYIYQSDDAVVAGVPQTPAKVQAEVLQAEQQTLMALYTIPRGFIGLLFQIWVNGIRGSLATAIAASMRLQTRDPGGVFRTRHAMGWHVYGGAYQERYHCPLRLEALTDIKIICSETSAAGLEVGAGFDLVLVPDE